MRISSLKGAIRYWYRAIDPAYKRYEGVCFGSGGNGGGQSRFLMKLDEGAIVSTNKHDRRYCIQCNQIIQVTFMRKSTPTLTKEEVNRDWTSLQSAIWLLGHVGGLGARSRRCYGSLHLDPIAWRETENKSLPTLPIAHGQQTTGDWIEMFKKGLKEIRNRFPGEPENTHTVVNKHAAFYLLDTKFDTWREASGKIREDLKEFREKEKDTNRWWVDKAAIGLPFSERNMRFRVAGGEKRHSAPI
jgi:CRISPR-associated protein Cmr1